MLCSRTSNNMINKIHERALRLILNDHAGHHHSNHHNNPCNHHRNIKTQMAEIYKIKNNMNPPIMEFMFERRNNTYNLINLQEFAIMVNFA